MKRSICFWVVAVLAATLWLTLSHDAETLEGGKSVQELLTDADQANVAHDIELEKRTLTRALSTEGSAEDLARVERGLARLAWKYRHEFDEARRHLDAALARGEDASWTWLERARLELQAEQYGAARGAAEQARQTAETRSEDRAARLAWARTVLKQATAQRLAQNELDEKLVDGAFGILSTMVREEPGDLGPSRLLVGAAILSDRGSAVIEGWRSYYHVSEGRGAPGEVAAAGPTLKRLFADWKGAETDAETRIEAVAALAESRFFTEAALLALDPRAANVNRVRENPRVREIVAYTRFCRSVEAIANEYYRGTILGESALEEFKRRLQSEVATLWPALAAPAGPAPRFGTEGRFARAVTEELGPRFGTEFILERAGRRRNLRLGHRVVDDTRIVEQYGHRAKLRFLVLDSMFSNGFNSWAWNNGAQAGGWAINPTITQVRPAYASGPLRAWRLVTDDDEIAELDEAIARESALDEQRARENPYAYLPGLAKRLQRQGRRQLLEKLAAEGLEGDALRMAFVAEYERVVTESSIFAHEGRHAIDKATRGLRFRASKNKEFLAKLSEVTFAPEPRLSVGAIFYSNIGADSGHGQANERIMKGLVKWMDGHRSEIADLDQGRPLLPQFDLLTDDQIRAAFRSMDPLVK